MKPGTSNMSVLHHGTGLSSGFGAIIGFYGMGENNFFLNCARREGLSSKPVNTKIGVIQMPFIPYSNDTCQGIAITVDNQGRICLSAGLRRRLGCENEAIELILFFEQETRRIGIAKDYPGKHKPFKFDKDRGYCKVEKFLNDNDIEWRDGAVRYYYDGTYEGIMAFKATQDYATPVRTRLRQERNGNLERA